MKKRTTRKLHSFCIIIATRLRSLLWGVRPWKCLRKRRIVAPQQRINKACRARPCVQRQHWGIFWTPPLKANATAVYFCMFLNPVLRPIVMWEADNTDYEHLARLSRNGHKSLQIVLHLHIFRQLRFKCRDVTPAHRHIHPPIPSYSHTRTHVSGQWNRRK